MKIPIKPPNWREGLSEVLRHRPLTELISDVGIEALQGNRYLHWDRIRRMPPPGRLSHEGWWAVIKAQRQGILRPLPIKANDNHPFVYAGTDVADKFLHEIDRNAAGQILANERFGREDRERYVISNLMEEAITSSQLEGAATTRLVAVEMLRRGRKPRDKSERMIANNYRAMQEISELKNQPLSPEMILHLHEILGEDALDQPDAAGRFRRAGEDVRVRNQFNETLHTPPPVDQLPERLAALCDFANEKTPDYFVHPVVRAIALHFSLAYDHPFVDGNGRCARALFYWSMLRAGYWLIEFISISQRIRKAPIKYGRAFLETETDDNDLTYFVLYHLSLIQKAIDDVRQYLDRKMDQVHEAEELLRDSVNINHRQIALLSHALRHSTASYTIASHQRSQNVVYQTARQDLFDLAKRGLLRTTKRGRTYYFFPAANLEARMRKLR